MATNIKFHRITATSGSNINTGTNYTKGDVYFIKSATGNTGKVYICTVAGKGTAATLEDYSVNTNTWRPIGTGATDAAAGNHTHTFASLTSKPTTISGYGITDALTTSNYTSYTVKKNGTGASGTWGISISGNAATATTATKIGTSTVGSTTMPVYINSGAPTAITSFPEAYLSWGGTNTSGSVTPIGMTLSSEHSANRLAFINGNALTFEYSSDAGSTWTDYGYTASIKSEVFTKSYGVPIGRANSSTEYTTNSRTRITLTAQDGTNGYVYTNPRKMLININTAAPRGIQVLIEHRTGTNYKNNGAWTTFGTYTLLGGSGWNDIPLILETLGGGSTQTANNWQLRLTFIMTSKSSNYPTNASVNRIRIFGENAWTSPSTMASTGHLYTYDASQNAIFPAAITSTMFKKSGGTSSQFLKADGSVDSNTYSKSNHTHSSILDVNNNTATTFAYSKTAMNYGDYSWLAAWNGYELRAINKNQFAQASHNHDNRYYTESEIDTKLSGKANTNHTHTKSQITDFPTSLPASDVYSWAKQSTKPSYSFSEITSKPTTVSGYGITDAITKLVNITWSGLKTLRDSGKLVPGQQYRITDYTCTTSQNNTRSAGHAFDIIVTADNESILNEVARAIKHTGDTYFNGCDLNAWQIWYCLDNDTNRFAWANTTNGKGVIYRMIDEFSNDCPYDFKNIQFYRKWDPNTESHSIIPSPNKTDDFIPCYTFSSEDNPDTVEFTDNSLTSSTNVYFNVIKEYIDYHNKQTLNNICFFNGNIHNNTFGYNCYNSTIGDDCQYNTFGSNCYNNIFSNDCDYNTFGNGCASNTLGNLCVGNTFGCNCYNNIFGSECSDNIFSNDCDCNTFGNDCASNTFRAGCDGNIFGTGCDENVFGNRCSNNTLGNNCTNNAFENNCSSNALGISCDNNFFGINCDTNTLKDDCNNNNLGTGCNNNLFNNTCGENTLGANCIYNSFGTNCLGNSFGNYCEHNTFANSCSYNAFGNRSNSNIFGESCGSNTFGNSSSSNTFGSNCSYNSLGNSCNFIKFASSSSDTSSTRYNYYQHNHFGDGCTFILFKGAQTASSTAQIQRYNIAQGLSGNPSTYITILGKRNRAYDTTVSRDGSMVYSYCLADVASAAGVTGVNI